jgi:hypothetical protein
MERCLECNSLLAKDEKVCIGCGSAIPGVEKRNPARLFPIAVKGLFYLSLAFLFTAIFFTNGPPLIMSLLLTAALLFLMRTTADLVAPKQKKH